MEGSSPRPPEPWTECDIRPPDTVTEGVRGVPTETRPWLAGAPVVPALGALGIAHAGVITASAPYRIVRTRLSGAYFMATLSGTGRVYLEGRWVECPAGHAVMLMPGVLNAFYAAGGAPWSHCWLRLARGAEVLHGPADRMQMLTPWDSGALGHALRGLRSEALHRAAPPLLRQWAELVLHSVNYFHRPSAPDARIIRLWTAVEEDLSGEWSMRGMARVASLSPEHLRRLTHAATGRAPRAQLTHLRMKRAAALLRDTEWSVERIAEAVGYASASVFSTAFKKVTGWPPSVYSKHTR